LNPISALPRVIASPSVRSAAMKWHFARTCYGGGTWTSLAMLRPSMKTSAPAPTSSNEIARPMGPDAPATRATASVRFIAHVRGTTYRYSVSAGNRHRLNQIRGDEHGHAIVSENRSKRLLLPHSHRCIHPAVGKCFVGESNCCDSKTADEVHRKRMQPARNGRIRLVEKQWFSPFAIH